MNTTPPLSSSQLRGRLIKASEMRYSTEAFIDYRIPGCGPKKNYALIGPGVSQNPNQPVSLREKHGFQVGGVAMGPGISNPPHMHFTAEVFICTRGRWQLHWGFNPDRLECPIAPGDVASMPTWIYRGFRSLGTDSGQEGFMFTALGRDDTGGILWGAATLAAARAQGVHLTEDYRIIDEHAGLKWDDSTMKRLEPMTPQEVGQLRSWDAQQMSRRVVRFADLDWSSHAVLDGACAGSKVQLAPVIGHGMSADRHHLAPIMNSHGFSIEWIKIAPGGQLACHQLANKQVLAMHRGELEIGIGNEPFADFDSDRVISRFIVQGNEQGNDAYAMPDGVWRSFRNNSSADVLALLMTAGDERKHAVWAPDVVVAAARLGWGIDADGYVGLKRYIDRSQR